MHRKSISASKAGVIPAAISHQNNIVQKTLDNNEVFLQSLDKNKLTVKKIFFRINNKEREDSQNDAV